MALCKLKDDKLRLALLDYLKRYHPNDHETYTMVTLNFTMHREIASMLEEAAYQQLKLLENKTIGKCQFLGMKTKKEVLTNLCHEREHTRDPYGSSKHLAVLQ